MDTPTFWSDMSIFWLVVVFAAFAIWITLLLWENAENYKWRKKIEDRKKRLKEMAKKAMKEFKWPEDLPRFPD